MKTEINFNSEEECALFFKEFREKMGVECKDCGDKEHYWLPSKKQWQCKVCRFRTTLKSGTALQHSNMKISTWLKAISLYSDEETGLSAKSLQRELGIKRYEPAWAMLHKVRKFMGQWTRNLHCPNSGFVHQGKIWARCSRKESSETGVIARTQSLLMIYGVQTQENIPELNQIKSGIRMFIVNKYHVPPVNKYLIEKWNERISFSYPQGIKNESKLKRLTLELEHIKRRIMDVHCGISEYYVANYLNDYCFRRNFKSHPNILFLYLLKTLTFQWWSIS